MLEAPLVNPEQDQDHEALDPQQRIASAKNVDELVTIVRSLDTVHGGKRTYTGAELAGKIEAACDNPAELMTLTNTYGLRDKARELIEVEITTR